MELGHLMDTFKVVDFMEVLDQRGIPKVMQVVCMAVVKSQAAGQRQVLWHPLEEGA